MNATLKKKLPFIIVPLALVAILLLFSSNILTWLSSGSGKGQGTISTLTPTPLPYHPTVVAFCGDTPPIFTLGHLAALSVANMLDASVKFGSPGILFFGS